MKSRTSNIVLFGMVIGAILGILGGYFFGNILIHVKFLGTIFLNALKMVVIPLVIASLIVGVTSLGDIRKLGRTTGKTLLYYLATTSFSVLIGIILVNLISPGSGVPAIGAAVPDFVRDTGGNTVIDVIVRLIPDNIVGAAADGRILPLIVFSLLFGGVLTTIGSKGKPIIEFFEGINAAIMKIVMLIIYFAPIGVFALIGGIVAEHRESVDELLSALGLYSLTVIIGLLIHAVIVLPLILKFFGRKRPLQYFTNMGRALATAFTTASSSATLPLTMEAVEVENKVDRKASSFVLPLGATINMDGTALYEAVAAIFIAQIYGIDLSIGAQVLIFFTATLASIGAAAIPEAGLVMMSLVLTAVGLPLEGIGVILAIDWFLDRCRTTVNVWGDSIGAAVIGETAEIKDYLRPSIPSKTNTSSAGSRTSTNGRSSRETSDRTGRQNSRSDSRHKGPRSYDNRGRDKKYQNDKRRHDKGSRYSKNGRHERHRDDSKKFVPKKPTYAENNKPNKIDNSDKPAKPIRSGKPNRPVNNKPQTAPKDNNIPRDTIDKELTRVRQQLASMNGKSDIANGPDKSEELKKTSKTEKMENTDKKEKNGSDNFFDVEFSKIDFFSDQEKADKSESTPDRKTDHMDDAPMGKPEEPKKPVSYKPGNGSTDRPVEKLTYDKSEDSGETGRQEKKDITVSAADVSTSPKSSEPSEPPKPVETQKPVESPKAAEPIEPTKSSIEAAGSDKDQKDDKETVSVKAESSDGADTGGDDDFWGREKKKRPSR